MNIDFEEVRNGAITKELIISLLEKIYLITKTDIEQNITINEYVDDMTIDTENNLFFITLKNIPLSTNDILIVSENGEIVLTPHHIRKVEKNKITFTHSKIKNKINFFVTYKY